MPAASWPRSLVGNEPVVSSVGVDVDEVQSTLALLPSPGVVKATVRSRGPGSDVVRLAQGGDADARDELARAASRIAYPFALQLLGQRETAKDVAQDALLRLFGKLDRFDPDQPLAPWLRRIVRNRAIDVVRHGKIRRHESLGAEGDGSAAIQIADSRVDVAGSAQFREQQSLLFRALQGLPVAQREIVVLRDYQDLSYGEIADLLGVPKGTVMSRLHRARKALRESLRDDRRTKAVEGSTGPLPGGPRDGQRK